MFFVSNQFFRRATEAVTKKPRKISDDDFTVVLGHSNKANKPNLTAASYREEDSHSSSDQPVTAATAQE